jgi:hypothetical protein
MIYGLEDEAVGIKIAHEKILSGFFLYNFIEA